MTPLTFRKRVSKTLSVDIDGYKVLLYDKMVIAQAQSIMELTHGAKIHRMSKIKEMSAAYPGLAEALPTGFEGSDPFIVVHNKTLKDGKNYYDISLFELSTESLNFTGKGLQKGVLVTENFIDHTKARQQGVVHSADLRNVRKIMVGMQLMAIKNADESINIRKSGIIEMTPFKGTRTIAGKINYSPVNINVRSRDHGIE